MNTDLKMFNQYIFVIHAICCYKAPWEGVAKALLTFEHFPASESCTPCATPETITGRPATITRKQKGANSTSRDGSLSTGLSNILSKVISLELGGGCLFSSVLYVPPFEFVGCFSGLARSWSEWVGMGSDGWGCVGMGWVWFGWLSVTCTILYSSKSISIQSLVWSNPHRFNKCQLLSTSCIWTKL